METDPVQYYILSDSGRDPSLHFLPEHGALRLLHRILDEDGPVRLSCIRQDAMRYRSTQSKTEKEKKMTTDAIELYENTEKHINTMISNGFLKDLGEGNHACHARFHSSMCLCERSKRIGGV
jgi:hypothetical protein